MATRTNQIAKNEVLGEQEHAGILGVKRNAVYLWRLTGKIKGKPIGMRINGRPLIISYNLDEVKEDLKQNLTIKEILKKKLKCISTEAHK